MEKDVEALRLQVMPLDRIIKSNSYASIKSRHLETIIFHRTPLFLTHAVKCPQSPLPAFQVIFDVQCKYCLIITLSVQPR